MNGRESEGEESRQQAVQQQLTLALEQAEIAGHSLAMFCETFLSASQTHGVSGEEALRLLVAALSSGYGR